MAKRYDVDDEWFDEDYEEDEEEQRHTRRGGSKSRTDGGVLKPAARQHRAVQGGLAGLGLDSDDDDDDNDGPTLDELLDDSSDDEDNDGDDDKGGSNGKDGGMDSEAVAERAKAKADQLSKRQALAKTLRQTQELFDPDADEQDEAWMHKQLDKPQSDAVLSCPMCFTPICYDCQRHETYKTQFRAMFVSNVSVSYGEVLRYGATPTPKKGSQKQKQAQGGDVPTGYRPQDVYHPVRCQTCDCEVGVIDHEEIYHFFNVIAE